MRTAPSFFGRGGRGKDWRDAHPSGAASIEWFDRWIKTGDPAIRQRILDYNEDDCRATACSWMAYAGSLFDPSIFRIGPV
jgi:hypothetical protein